MTTNPRPACQLEARNCPACGSNVKARACPITDRYGWMWALHVCYRCGVEYQARPMTDAARRDFYASGLYRRLCAQVTGKPWDDPKYLCEAQRDYAARWQSRVPHRLPSGWWLDFGGSTGSVAASWAAGGRGTVVVADYGDGAVVAPEQALDAQWLKHHSPDGAYDALVCCQTLDHLRDPLATLQQFLHVAKPGARLFVDVVKRAHTAYKIDHETYYTHGSILLALVERSGWVPLWLDSETNPTHYSVLAEKPNA